MVESPRERTFSPWTHRLAIAVAAATLLLIVVIICGIDAVLKHLTFEEG